MLCSVQPPSHPPPSWICCEPCAQLVGRPLGWEQAQYPDHSAHCITLFNGRRWMFVLLINIQFLTSQFAHCYVLPPECIIRAALHSAPTQLPEMIVERGIVENHRAACIQIKRTNASCASQGCLKAALVPLHHSCRPAANAAYLPWRLQKLWCILAILTSALYLHLASCVYDAHPSKWGLDQKYFGNTFGV